MLEIKQKFKISFPTFPKLIAQPVVFEPTIDDDDELMTAIAQDATERGNDWELSEYPDTDELERYWQRVEADISHDSEWFTFANNSQTQQ